MKKLISVLLAGLLVAAMGGCSGTDGSTASAGEKLQVGVVQIMEHTSLDTIRESFLQQMEQLGYGEYKVDYDIQNAQGEQTNLGTICQKFVGDGVDMIVAIATPTAQTAAASTSEIPILFSAVTDPVEAKLLTDPQHPDGNVTGTSDAIPVDQVMQLCQELTPEVQKIGFLYTTSEINAQVTTEQAMEAAEQMGYETQLMTISEVSELQQAAQSLAQEVDAIYVPIDNTIARQCRCWHRSASIFRSLSTPVRTRWCRTAALRRSASTTPSWDKRPRRWPRRFWRGRQSASCRWRR